MFYKEGEKRQLENNDETADEASGKANSPDLTTAYGVTVGLNIVRWWAEIEIGVQGTGQVRVL